MTNAQGGARLYGEILSAIALAYGWPDFHPIERTMIQLPPGALSRFAGTYEIANLHVVITITVENGQLMVQVNNQPKSPSFPSRQHGSSTEKLPWSSSSSPTTKARSPASSPIRAARSSKRTRSPKPLGDCRTLTNQRSRALRSYCDQRQSDRQEDHIAHTREHGPPPNGVCRNACRP